MSQRKAASVHRCTLVRGPFFTGLGLLLLLSGCGVRALDPAGPAAAAIADLWWVMFAVSVVVFVGVMVALAIALRGRRVSVDRGDELGRRLVAVGGALIPGIIVLGLMIYNTYITVKLEEPPSPPVMTIDVESHQWWWDVHYPDYDFTTANEIHIPAGQSVLLQLHSHDVIHAFWVPELHGKRDMMPDFRGEFWLQADEPGTYRGQCAEFCGLQHAKMLFLVIAHEPDEFQSWLQEREAPRPEITDPQALRGQQVFLDEGCAACHTVRDTEFTGTVGPDLSNIASRRELGAGTLPNTPGNLAAWIIDSQQFKPGNRMPPSPMPGEDLRDLLTYLENLR